MKAVVRMKSTELWGKGDFKHQGVNVYTSMASVHPYISTCIIMCMYSVFQSRTISPKDGDFPKARQRLEILPCNVPSERYISVTVICAYLLDYAHSIKIFFTPTSFPVSPLNLLYLIRCGKRQGLIFLNLFKVICVWSVRHTLHSAGCTLSLECQSRHASCLDLIGRLR